MPDPITIIIASIVSGLIAAAIWSVLTDFLTRVIETVLPRRYGKKVSAFVRKVIGLVRKAMDWVDHVELIASVLESSGSVVRLESEHVEWSEVPDDVRRDIKSKGQYRYEMNV